jgi:HEAT repeat protein
VRWYFCILAVGWVVSLGGCGPARPTTAGDKPVSYWVQTLQGPDARARKRAAFTLGNVGAADPTVVPALVGALQDRDASVRGESVLALLKIGPPARAAVPALAEAQKDQDAQVRAYAVKALEKIQGGP